MKMIPLAKGITIHCGNKRFVGKIPEIYIDKYKLDISPAKKAEKKEEKKVDGATG